MQVHALAVIARKLRNRLSHLAHSICTLSEPDMSPYIFMNVEIEHQVDFMEKLTHGKDEIQIAQLVDSM